MPYSKMPVSEWRRSYAAEAWNWLEQLPKLARAFDFERVCCGRHNCVTGGILFFAIPEDKK